jgi:hypothetical protein
METIFARVEAKPIAFPDDIEMRYHCLDENGMLTGKVYDNVHWTWERIQSRFGLDADFADQCVEDFRKGESKFFGNQFMTVEV